MSAIPQQYLADTYLNSGGDIPNESNGSQDVYIDDACSCHVTCDILNRAIPH